MTKKADYTPSELGKKSLTLSIFTIIISFLCALGCYRYNGAVSVWLGIFTGVSMIIGVMILIISLISIANYEGDMKKACQRFIDYISGDF